MGGVAIVGQGEPEEDHASRRRRLITRGLQHDAHRIRGGVQGGGAAIVAMRRINRLRPEENGSEKRAKASRVGRGVILHFRVSYEVGWFLQHFLG